jgi:hypothetical protein
MLDVDPYGEEEWLEERLITKFSEFVNEGKHTQIIDLKKYMREHGANVSLVRELRRLFVNRKVQFYWINMHLDGTETDIKHPTIKIVENVATSFGNEYIYFLCKGHSGHQIPWRVNIDKSVKIITNVIISKDDPYGEEDWEDEEEWKWGDIKEGRQVSTIDPYGEEDWEDRDKFLDLYNNIQKIEGFRAEMVDTLSYDGKVIYVRLGRREDPVMDIFKVSDDVVTIFKFHSNNRYYLMDDDLIKTVKRKLRECRYNQK